MVPRYDVDLFQVFGGRIIRGRGCSCVQIGLVQNRVGEISLYHGTVFILSHYTDGLILPSS